MLALVTVICFAVSETQSSYYKALAVINTAGMTWFISTAEMAFSWGLRKHPPMLQFTSASEVDEQISPIKNMHGSLQVVHRSRLVLPAT
eukprot:2993921-Amphidinium_carterae.1